MFKNFTTAVVVRVLAIVLIAIVGMIAAIPVYFLWNWLMPEIFGIKVLTFWQAWGIAFLSGLLFKSSSIKTS